MNFRGSKIDERQRFDRRDWLIAFVLFLATIQCVRADFLVNETFLDWRAYSKGIGPLPYQGRVAMMPILRWADGSARMKELAQRYAKTVTAGTKHTEPITVEKFTSMLVGMASLSAMMFAASLWSWRRAVIPWWLTNLLVLMMTAATLVMRATQNYWYAYDLPHACLFGIGALLLLEGGWLPAIFCFALDVPMRETSIFSVLIAACMFWVHHRSDRVRSWKTIGLTTAMGIYWLIVRGLIARRFAGNTNLTYSRLAQNLHELVYPHHWPQLFSAGGFLFVFIWLERNQLSPNQKVFLYSCLCCFPLTLWYGVWTESRVWLEWTLPMAVLAATEASNWMQSRQKPARALL